MLVPLFALAMLSISVPAWVNEKDEYVPPTFAKPPGASPGATRYIYKTGENYALPIYVFSPRADSRPVGAVIFFHGSGWHSGTVVQFVEHARRLAELGMVARRLRIESKWTTGRP